MKYSVKILLLAGVVLIGANTEAFLSTNASLDGELQGYHCSSLYQQRKIKVTHSTHTFYGYSCNVVFQKNQGNPLVLWSNQRNIDTCESKAQSLVIRLRDRGWNCSVMAP